MGFRACQADCVRRADSPLEQAEVEGVMIATAMELIKVKKGSLRL